MVPIDLGLHLEDGVDALGRDVVMVGQFPPLRGVEAVVDHDVHLVTAMAFRIDNDGFGRVIAPGQAPAQQFDPVALCGVALDGPVSATTLSRSDRSTSQPSRSSESSTRRCSSPGRPNWNT